jgi:hypothetical protein
MAKSRYLVCYDHGMGGVWASITADSPDEITTKYPQLTVLTERPSWMTIEKEPGVDMTFDIDDPPTGWLTLLDG